MTSFSSLLYFERDYSLWSDSAALWCLLGLFLRGNGRCKMCVYVVDFSFLLFYTFLMAVYDYDVADCKMAFGEAKY